MTTGRRDGRMAAGWKLTSAIALLIASVTVAVAQPVGDTLPPAKQAIEDQYATERDAGNQDPAASDPNAQLPSVQLPAFETGVFVQCDPFPGGGVRTVNCWNGIVDGVEVTIYAGAQKRATDADGNLVEEPDPQQGVLVVDGEPIVFAPAPVRDGGLSILAERNGILTVLSEGGRVWAFDVRTRQFTSVSAFACPNGQGFWKAKPGVWPTKTVVLGNDRYSQEELLAILRSSVGGGGGADASVILAHQLIAAKLNIANGSNPVPIADALRASDDLLLQLFNDKDKVPFRVPPSTAAGQAMVNYASKFDAYNSGRLTPTCSR